MYFYNADHLVLIDYNTKWIETTAIQSNTAAEITNKSQEIFLRFGIPETIVIMSYSIVLS